MELLNKFQKHQFSNHSTKLWLLFHCLLMNGFYERRPWSGTEFIEKYPENVNPRSSWLSGKLKALRYSLELCVCMNGRTEIRRNSHSNHKNFRAIKWSCNLISDATVHESDWLKSFWIYLSLTQTNKNADWLCGENTKSLQTCDDLWNEAFHLLNRSDIDTSWFICD